MDMTMDISTPLGIAIVVIGLIVAVKAIKIVIKLVMVALVLFGLYLVFGADLANGL